MKIISLKIFVLAALVLACQNSWAAAPSPQMIAQELQKAYNQTKTLTADFQQITVSQMSHRKKFGSGTLILAKPGLMRWDYQKPDHQVFVCDGNTISMYFSKEKQMIVSSAQQYLESDLTYSFFAGTGDILRDFIVTSPDEEDIEDSADAYQIKIVPKHGNPQIDYINIWADHTSFLLKRIKVTDKFGSETEINFSNLVRNETIDQAIFTFRPPPGTELVQQ